MASDDMILDILVENGKITEEQIENAKGEVGVRASTVLGVLVILGALDEKSLISFLAEYFSMERIEIADHTIRPEVLDLVPSKFARDNMIMPVDLDAGVLKIAMTNPMDVDTIDNLTVELSKSAKTSDLQIETLIAGPVDIQNALDLYYRGQQLASAVEDASEDDYEQALKGIGDLVEGGEGDEAPIIRFVSAVISQAYHLRASDIHIEPLEKRVRIRYRIDGVLKEMESPPKRLQGPIISRLKIMSGMNMAERRVPQDGRIKFAVDKITLDLRVSALPGIRN